jgi:hypothetical protein
MDIQTIAAIVVATGGAIGILKACDSSKTADVLSQIQDDSAYARATRAVAWIDNNQWRLLHHKDSTLK